MKNTDYTTAVRHGELYFEPVADLPKGAVKTFTGDSYIVGHSETGHHHTAVAESVEIFSVGGLNESFLRIAGAGRVEHKKPFQAHETKPLVDGIYRIHKKTEFDYLANVKREVRD